jgi:hypothetical protein
MAELEFPVHLGLDAMQLAVELEGGDVAADIVDGFCFRWCFHVRSVMVQVWLKLIFAA